MIEDEIRATFARHETLAPSTDRLRAAIDRLARRRRRRRIMASAGTVLALLAAAAVPVAGWGLATDPPAADLLAPPAVKARSGPLDLLVLGLDGRPTGDPHGDVTSRADTVLIAHVPADRSRIYVVSLPRDLVVDIPGRGRDRLSSAFAIGSMRPGGKPDLMAGARLTARVVGDLTGVRLTGTVTITYRGLRDVTDAAGGVRVCLPETVVSVHTNRTFPAGCQRLDGDAARDLLRQRRGMKEGGLDRDRNAQRFLAALAAQVIGSGIDPVRLSALLRAGGHGVTIDGFAGTDLLPVLAQLSGAEVTGIGWTFAETEIVRETGWQNLLGLRLNPELSRSLFDALRRDVLADWVRAHPAQVTDFD